MKTMIIGVEKKEEYNICEDCILYNKDEIDRLSKMGKEWVEFADSIEIVDCRHDYACVFCGKERYVCSSPKECPFNPKICGKCTSSMILW